MYDFSHGDCLNSVSSELADQPDLSNRVPNSSESNPYTIEIVIFCRLFKEESDLICGTLVAEDNRHKKSHKNDSKYEID